MADKSNELTAVPKILEQLYIKGAIVTLDAMGCQEATVAQIYDAEADYIMALTGNQREFHAHGKDGFELLDKGATTLQSPIAQAELDAQHGRMDRRAIQGLAANQLVGILAPRWKGLNRIARVFSTSKVNGPTMIEPRFYISLLAAEQPLEILASYKCPLKDRKQFPLES